MILLGIFVNAIFLLAAVLGLCGVSHLFGGHHCGTTHSHQSDEKEKKSI